jgi:hypothetical protein
MSGDDKTSFASDIFLRSASFSSLINRIDDMRQRVNLMPLPSSDWPRAFPFGKFIMVLKMGMEIKLKIALCLSAGMIFLSPTPWDNPDSTELWEKGFF